MSPKDKKEFDKQYQVKRVTIGGYKMVTMKIGDRYSVTIPRGRNAKDKQMFDKLVYYNSPMLYDKSREEVIKRVRKWISDYRRQHA